MVVAAGCVVLASFSNNGSYHPVGLTFLAAALAAVLLAVGGWLRFAAVERLAGRGLLLLLIAVLGVELCLLLFASAPLNHNVLDPSQLSVVNGCVIAMAALAVGPLVLPRERRSLALPALVLLHGCLGIWLLKLSPKPVIDVWLQAQAACQAFSRGVNPYTITFPNIYGELGPLVYPPGVLRDGVVHFGYQYMPLSFYPSFISWRLTGDLRYGGLLALEVAALLIGLCGREPFGRLSASLLLLFGAVYQVVENAWTEPYVICCLAATVYCAARRPKLFPWVLGLLLVSKQHMPLVALPVLLITGYRWGAIWPVAWRAAVVAATVTLPMAMWDWSAFYRGVFWVQLNNPFRPDSLSFAAWFAHQVGRPPPRMIELFAAAAGMALALWRCPRTPSGFALAVAATYLPLFAFGKQAFTNYWFFASAALAVSIVATTAELMPQPAARGMVAPGAPASSGPMTAEA